MVRSASLLAGALAALPFAFAGFNANGKDNVAIYWG